MHVIVHVLLSTQLANSIPAGLDGPLSSFRTLSAAPVEYVNPLSLTGKYNDEHSLTRRWGNATTKVNTNNTG